MNKRVTLVACVALLAAAWIVGAAVTTTSSSSGVTSCARIAYDYVAQVAKANQLRIDKYELLACHQLDADHTVARVHVVVSPAYLPKGVFAQDATLVYHLTRSPWQIADVHPVG